MNWVIVQYDDSLYLIVNWLKLKIIYNNNCSCNDRYQRKYTY